MNKEIRYNKYIDNALYETELEATNSNVKYLTEKEIYSNARKIIKEGRKCKEL